MSLASSSVVSTVLLVAGLDGAGVTHAINVTPGIGGMVAPKGDMIEICCGRCGPSE